MNFKKINLLTISLMFTTCVFAQKEPDKFWSSKYFNKKYSQWDYLSVAEKVKWKPVHTMFQGSYAFFEKAFIELCKDTRALEQMKIDGWYNCSTDHDYLYQRYNRSYNWISKEVWDEYCPILYILMELDVDK